MKSVIHSKDVESHSMSSLPAIFSDQMGKGSWRNLGDYFGLTHFGFNLEVLAPGAQSALRHWHSHSDEIVFVLAGELVLVTDEGESLLTQGMCAGFAAGDENGHHLVNRSLESAQFLVAGSRQTNDRVTYPDDDLQWVIDEQGLWGAARKDGTPY